jgi:hypothetical protein
MELSHEEIRDRFTHALEGFEEDWNLFTTFRTDENEIAMIPLKGFKDEHEAQDFIDSSFAPDECKTKIERIEDVLREIRQKELTDWESIRPLVSGIRIKQEQKTDVKNEPVLKKTRQRKHRYKM